MDNKDLLAILEKRYESAEKWTKENYIKQAIRAMADYEVEDNEAQDLSSMVDRHLFSVNKRYEFKVPVIFTNTEAMKAALFERLPELVISGRGEDDDAKQKMIEATYEYLKDRLNLFDVADKAAHWFILTGFAGAQANYEQRGTEEPIADEMGEPMLDMEGNPQTEMNYTYDDPIVSVLDPKKTYYAYDSEFDYKADGVSYYSWYKLISPEDIKVIYGTEVEADTSVVTDDKFYLDKEEKSKEDDKDRVKDMVKLKYYCGELPFADKEQLEELDLEYNPHDTYLFIWVNNQILYANKKDDKYIRLCKWYGHPNKFFGFGMGQIGRQFQIEKSIRRGQQIRFADIAAFPKIAIKNTDDIADNDLMDPRENVKLLYSETPPQYIQQGNLSEAVAVGSQEADNDAQKAFGILDLNTGSQTSTVETATGQTIFAQAANRRIEFAKKKFMSFYRELIILLFKMCQEYWVSDKVYTIMGENGEEEEVTLNKEGLAGIDFDKDIDIDMETLSMNKDVARQQYIVAYDKTKDDPLVERREVIKDMFKNGFSVKNPNKYVKDNELQPGAILVNQQTGEQYQVGEDGELISAQQQQGMAQPGAEAGMGAVPSSMGDILQSMPSPGEGAGMSAPPQNYGVGR